MQNLKIIYLPQILAILFFCSNIQVSAQDLLGNGKIHFNSDAPLELIEASSNQLAGVIRASEYTFAFKVPMRSFEGFNSSLQKEHFNENFMESEKFPYATFSGKIIEKIDFSVDGTHRVRAKGKLIIHGIEQERIIRGKLRIANGVVTIDTQFLVPLADHDITIPKIVNQKIATEIDVEISCKLQEKAN